MAWRKIKVKMMNNERRLKPAQCAQRHGALISFLFLPPCSSVVKFFFLLFILCVDLSAQVASRTDGVTVSYYDSLHEALAAATDNVATSIEQPDEITLLADIVLDEALLIGDGVHIRLVAGGGNRTIWRSGNLIEYPVIWVNGDGASLSLGKPGMGHELVIDGGRLNIPPIEAGSPLITITGQDSKLIMHDKVSLQNNKNIAHVSVINYELGSGVFISTRGDDPDRRAEFIMKGGTIRGNINDVQHPIISGGGVLMIGLSIFTMEGGLIMDNTARTVGGGFSAGGRSIFKKTGGIIYGSDAPAGYRNTALDGSRSGMLKAYGHALCVAAVNPIYWYRNDTVGENDNLSYTGNLRGDGFFGIKDKWDNLDKALRRMLVAFILPVLALAVCVFLVYRKRTLRKVMKIAQEAADQSANAVTGTVFENVQLTVREKEIGALLLTELSMKQIAAVVKLAYATTDYHSRKIYRKMGVQSRTELLIQVKNEKGKMKNEE